MPIENENKTTDVITSEKDIKSNAREANGDIKKGQDIKNDIYNHSYKGDNINTDLQYTENEWQAPVAGNNSFWEYVQDKSGAGFASNVLDEMTVTPEDGYGDSYWDKFAYTRKDYENLAELRGREQGIIPKLISGVGNMTLKAGTSFIGTFVSAINGVGAGIQNLTDDDENTTFFSGFVDNTSQKVIHDIEEWGEEVMPNYGLNTQKYQDKGAFAKLLTSTYWGQFLDNMGFTVGMMAAAMVPFMGEAGLLARGGGLLARFLGAGVRGIDNTYKLIAGTMMAIPEASMQGYNLYVNNKKEYEKEVYNKYDRELKYLQNKMNNAVDDDELLFLKGKYDEKQTEYEQEKANVNNRALAAGTQAFGLNMMILPISNTLGLMSFMRIGTTNANRIAKGSWLNMFRKKGEKEGISLAEARMTGIREMFVEGNEEMMQGWADNLATEYYSLDYDPESSNNFARFMNLAGKTFVSTYTDKNTLEEGLAGAIMGLTGAIMPHKGADGKWHILQGGMIEAWREAPELVKNSKEQFDFMNKVLKDPRLANEVRLSIASLAGLNKQMQKAAQEDKKGYQDYNNLLGIKVAQTFMNCGRLNDLFSLLGEETEMSEEELKKLSDMFVTPDPDNPGRFIPDNVFVDQEGNLISYSTEEDRKALADKLSKRKKEFKRLIKDYRDALYEADKNTGFKQTREYLDQLAWQMTQSRAWKARVEDMYNLDDFQRGINAIKDDLENLIEKGEEAENKKTNAQADVLSAEEQKTATENNLTERGEYLDTQHNAALAFIDKHYQELTRKAEELEKEAKELEEKANTTRENGEIFSEVEKEKSAKQRKKAHLAYARLMKKLKKAYDKINTLSGEDSSTKDEYKKIIDDLYDEITAVENEINESFKNDKEVKNNADELANDLTQQANDKKQEAYDKIIEAQTQREEELEDLEKNHTYDKEYDKEYQDYKKFIENLKETIEELKEDINRYQQEIEKGQKAKKEKEGLDSIKIEQQFKNKKIKKLKDLMNYINSFNLLKKLLSGEDLFDFLISLMDEVESMSESEKEKFIALVKDMKRCMISYNHMDDLINKAITDPSVITNMQEKVKSQVASAKAKATREALDNDLEYFDDFGEDSEDLISEDDRDSDAYSRLDETQINQLRQSYEALIEIAKNRLNSQLMILGWDNEKRQKYVERVINSTIANHAKKNENFNNFLIALDLSNKFSELFDEMTENVNFQGIDVSQIKYIARQLFETANLYAYSHGFHPMFLNNDEIRALFEMMSPNMNLDEDVHSQVAYACVCRMFDIMNRKLREAKVYGNTDSNIKNGQITDLSTGETFNADNPSDAITNNEHTRDNTGQITGVTVIGNLDDIVIQFSDSPKTDTPPKKPPVPPTPTNTSESSNSTDKNDRNDKNDESNDEEETDGKKPVVVITESDTARTCLGVLDTTPEIDYEFASNRRTQATNLNKAADAYMRSNNGYDFVAQGGLRNLLEVTNGKVDVYVATVDNISNTIFFYVKKEDGSFQVIGYIQDKLSGNSNFAKTLFELSQENVAPAETIHGYNAKYKNSKGELVSVNFDIEGTSENKITNKPKILHNTSGQPLRILKVGDNGILLQGAENPVSETFVGEKTFEDALEEGTVGLLWNTEVLGDEKINYDAKGFTRPSVLYKGDDGKFHHMNVKTKPLSETLENDDNIMTKVLKKALKQAINNAIERFNKDNPNNKISDLREYDRLSGQQKNQLKKILAAEIFNFNKNNIDSNFNNITAEGKVFKNPSIVVTDRKDGILTVEYSVKNANGNKIRLFNINLEINDGSQATLGAEKEEYNNNLVNQFVNGLVKLESETLDNEGNRVTTSLKDDSKYQEAPMRIMLNREYKEDYMSDLKGVAQNLTSSFRNWRPTNSRIGFTFQDENAPFDNDAINWSSYSKIHGKTHSANKEVKFTINGLTYYFKEDRDEHGFHNGKIIIYTGEPRGKDKNKKDAYRVNPSEFLKEFDPENILENNTEKLNEVLYKIFKEIQRQLTLQRELDRFIKVSDGCYFDVFTSKLVKTIPKGYTSSTKDTTTNQGQEVVDRASEVKTENSEDNKIEDTETKKTEDDKENNGIEKGSLNQDIDLDDIDEDEYGRQSQSNETDNNDDTIRIKGGLYNGILLLREIKDKMFRKIKNLDADLLEFIENNLSPRLRVKVLNDKQWEKYVQLNPSAAYSKAQYSVKNNCIYIRTNTDAVTIMHELTHAATVQAIKEALETNDISIKELNEILGELQQLAKENPELFKNIQGINNFTKDNKSDLFEMVAEIIANKDLQNFLKKRILEKKKVSITKKMEIKETSPKNLFQKFVTWVKDLFRQSKPQYKEETVDKIITYTMFDKFKENVMRLKPQTKGKPSIREKINNKIRRKSYTVQAVNDNSEEGITEYTSRNLNKNGKTINIEKFLSKYDFNGNLNSEWSNEVNEFNSKYDTDLNLNDTSEEGKKNLMKFAEFLREKGYEGIDLITGRDLAFSKYAKDERLIVFNSVDRSSNATVASRLNVPKENIENLSAKSQYRLQHCF